MKKTLLNLIVLPLLLFTFSASAQQVGIKTNLLYWATTTPNLGVEVALRPKVTLHVAGSANLWTFGESDSNKKIQHWTVNSQVRFWTHEKFSGSFLAPQVSFVSYNSGGINIPMLPFADMKNYRYEGYATGVGLTYGYQWYLGNHWNLEVSAGIGYMYLNYDKYDCHKCGSFIEKDTKQWFGPTNAGITLIYLIKSGK